MKSAKFAGITGLFIKSLPMSRLRLVESVASRLAKAFTEAVTEPIGCHYEEDSPRSVSVSVYAEVGLVLRETITFQFSKGRLDIIDLEEAPVLRRVASILGNSYLNLISRKYGGPGRGIIP